MTEEKIEQKTEQVAEDSSAEAKKDTAEKVVDVEVPAAEAGEKIEEEIETEAGEEEDIHDLPGEWYIAHVFSGYEAKVKTALEKKMQKSKLLKKNVFKIFIPEEQVVEIKNNKRIEKKKKMFPGYIFINMNYNEDVWFHIRNVTGVARFIGSTDKPQPVLEQDMARVLKQSGKKGTKKIEVDFEVDESVKVISGPFRGYTGTIAEIYPEKGKMKVLMSIFGRETPMEIAFDQAEKNI